MTRRARALEAGVTSVGQRWTPEEDALLIRLWPEASREEILQAFPGRTWHGIQQRGSKLRKRDRSLAQPPWRKRTPVRERRRLVFERIADETLRTGYGLTQTEISRDVGLHLSTVKHVVTALEKAGLVMKVGNRRNRAICLPPIVRARLEARRKAYRKEAA